MFHIIDSILFYYYFQYYSNNLFFFKWLLERSSTFLIASLFYYSLKILNKTDFSDDVWAHRTKALYTRIRKKKKDVRTNIFRTFFQQPFDKISKYEFILEINRTNIFSTIFLLIFYPYFRWINMIYKTNFFKPLTHFNQNLYEKMLNFL